MLVGLSRGAGRNAEDDGKTRFALAQKALRILLSARARVRKWPRNFRSTRDDGTNLRTARTARQANA